nr:dihydrolipoyl dehydrogenase [Gammaproteobacteria bacterium]
SKELRKALEKRGIEVHTGTKVAGQKTTKKGVEVALEGEGAPATVVADKVLVAVGRRPNGHGLGLEEIGVEVDERGFVKVVNEHMQTTREHVYAIGDVARPPLLAHKASHEGKVAAEVIAGLPAAFDTTVIPSVAYTDPEVAWVGLTEDEAKAAGIAYDKGVFPWAASGRSLSLGRSDGMTKLLFDRETKRVIGAGIVGPNAGDLIAEAALAIEMGCDAEDIGLTIHPHPTLSETIAFAAEVAAGTVTDLYVPKR